MSQENVEIVRRAGETWNESGTAVFAQKFLTDDVLYEDDPSWPDRQTAHGKEEVIQRFEVFFEVWGDWDATIERVVDSGDDRVVSTFTLRTTGSTSGATQEYTWGYVFELRDGLIWHFRAYLDPTEALATIGAE